MPHTILKVPKDGMIEGFNAAMNARGIVADPAQLMAAMRLQQFYDELIAFKAARRTKLRKMLARPRLPRGVWFWGGVGRGKSFLMDLPAQAARAFPRLHARDPRALAGLEA